MQPTSIEDYRKNSVVTKQVKVSSGAVFEIKKLTKRDLMLSGFFPAQSLKQVQSLSNEQRKEFLSEKITTESSLKLNNFLICKSVINPSLSMLPENGKLCVDELSQEDYDDLSVAINELSFSGGGEENLANFREWESSDINRQDGTEIQQASK